MKAWDKGAVIALSKSGFGFEKIAEITGLDYEEIFQVIKSNASEAAPPAADEAS